MFDFNLDVDCVDCVDLRIETGSALPQPRTRNHGVGEGSDGEFEEAEPREMRPNIFLHRTSVHRTCNLTFVMLPSVALQVVAISAGEGN